MLIIQIGPNFAGYVVVVNRPIMNSSLLIVTLQMLRSLLLSAFLAYVSVGRLANAYQSYQTLIPNGDRVPSPCNPAMTWSGVGHYIPAGGGDRNPFGQSFRALNRVCTAKLVAIFF